MHTLPETLQMQAQNVLSAAQQHCGALSGVYVHGSVCLGGYTPGRSDLDILIVCKQSMSRQARSDFADALLKIHNAPCPVELSVLTEEGLAHASPICTFHFSSMWAPRYAAHDDTNPLLDADFPDDDIPAYFRVARESGIRLYGEEAAALLPDVSDEAFYGSITDGTCIRPMLDMDRQDLRSPTLSNIAFITIFFRGKGISRTSGLRSSLTLVAITPPICLGVISNPILCWTILQISSSV